MSSITDLLKTLNKSFVTSGFEEITIDNSVKSLSVPPNSHYALCTVESDVTSPEQIVARFRMDGLNPTNTAGLPLNHLTVFTIKEPEQLNKFKIIQAQAGVHKLTVTYFK
jgi:hypothetical protein